MKHKKALEIVCKEIAKAQEERDYKTLSSLIEEWKNLLESKRGRPKLARKKVNSRMEKMRRIERMCDQFTSPPTCMTLIHDVILADSIEDFNSGEVYWEDDPRWDDPSIKMLSDSEYQAWYDDHIEKLYRAIKARRRRKTNLP